MGDDTGSDDTSATEPTSTAAGRPAHRRVKLDAKKAAAKPAPRPKVKQPFYRRGGFWFLVIVAEVLAALWLSYRFEPSTEYVDLAGADVPQFCSAVTDVRAKAAALGTVEVTNSVETFQNEQDAYRRLLPMAPTELRPDLEKLITGQAQLIETAREVQAKKAKDPSYLLGVSDIATKQSELTERYRNANVRLAVAVRQACNVDVNETVVPPTTTTVPGAPGAPGAPGPTVAGPVPGGAGSTLPPGSGP